MQKAQSVTINSGWPPRRLVLLGAGHAHVEVLRRFAARPVPGLAMTLVARERMTPYSGLLPAVLRGEIAPAAAVIDARALADRAGAVLREAAAVAIDPASRTVLCADGGIEPYDLLSVNVGGRPVMPPGAGIPVKPIDGLLARLDAAGLAPTRRVAVVGDGAAGCELALALAQRARVTLVGPSLLPGAPARARRIVADALSAAGVAHVPARATGHDGQTLLTDHGPVAADLALWATGVRGPGLLAASNLPCDGAGCLLVGPTLQCLGDPAVFAAGDCATLAAAPRPKAGVWAVRAGPMLAENLRRAVSGAPPLPWRPQSQALVILGLGGGQAVAWRNGVTLAGAWVARWKAHLDRRWMERYQPGS